jgi:hypothetical protein
VDLEVGEVDQTTGGAKSVTTEAVEDGSVGGCSRVDEVRQPDRVMAA